MATEVKRRGSIILRVVLVVFAIWMIYYLGSLIRQYSSLQNEYEKVTAEKNEKALVVVSLFMYTPLRLLTTVSSFVSSSFSKK